MMKDLLRLKYFIPAVVLFGSLSIWSFASRWGGTGSDEVEKVDVKSIRQNPGSFRSFYLPRLIYVGGK